MDNTNGENIIVKYIKDENKGIKTEKKNYLIYLVIYLKNMLSISMLL
jgi:hypothetical protein